MRLKRAYIENFRSLKKIDINFSKCTIFVGINNTGKSNVLKAIDLVIGEGYYRPSKNDYYNQDDSLIIKINLYFDEFTQSEIDDIKSKIIYNVRPGGVYYSADRIKDELEDKKVIHVETEIYQGNVDKKLYIGDIYYRYFSRDLRNAIVNAIFIPSVRDFSQMTAMYKSSILNKLIKMVYDNCPSDKKEELYRSLEDVSSKLNDIFEDCEYRLDEISKEIIDHEGLKISIVPSDYEDVYKKLHIVLNDGVESELDYKGTGIQSIIIISLFKLYSELKIGSALLLMEEPESYLHPQACRHMAKILREIGESENAQLIITTHSPHNIINVNLTDIVLFSKNNNYSEIRQVNIIENEIKLKKELNPDNLELFFSNKVILVEGDTDKFIIPKLAKQFNDNYDFDKKNMSIIGIGSKANLDVFISLLNSFNINWFALLDRDFISKTESLNLMKKINDLFGFGFDIDNESEITLINSFKSKRIYVLQFGEIENYYTLSWLNGILDSFIDDLSLSPGDDAWVKIQLSSINDTVQESSFKSNFFSTLRPNAYVQDILNKIISIKFQLLTLNLDQYKVGTRLEEIFRGLDLTKPRIAIKLLPYLNINELNQQKRDDIEEFINLIF